MNTESAFFERSKQITEEFLSTAIIIDDQANFGEYRQAQPTKVVTPVTRKKSTAVKATKDSRDQSKKEEALVKVQSHDLNAKKVINSFAQKGVLCSVIKPTEQEVDGLREIVIPLCNKADLIIYDWELSETSDKTALPLVKETISFFNENSPQQLRLIAIYTGATDIERVYDQVIEELKDNFEIINIADNCCQIDACRLLVIAKDTAKTAEGVTKISFEELANYLIVEYTKMTKGFLSNACLTAFTSLRNNLFNIISTFNASMDAPYLSHRTLLPIPPDAEELIFELICSEIKAVVDTPAARESVNIDMLESYIVEMMDDKKLFLDIKAFKDFENIKFPKEFDSEKIVEMLKVGIERKYINHDTPMQEAAIFRDVLYRYLTKLFSKNGETMLDEKFAILTTHKNTYSDKKPILKAGIVVKELVKGSSDVYWVCVQPLCDSVRIEKSNRHFSFLKLKDITDNDMPNCDLVVNDNNNYKYLKIVYSIYDSKQYKFKKNFNNMVQATNDDGKLIFGISGGKTLHFIAELRDEFAQSISNNFASNLSRVGLNPSEWLRRSMN